MNKSSCSHKGYSSLSRNKWKLATVITLALIVNSSQGILAQELNINIDNVKVTGKKLSNTLQETPSNTSIFNAIKIVQPNSEAILEASNLYSPATGVLNLCGKNSIGFSDVETSELTSVYLYSAYWTEEILYYFLFDLTFILVMGFFIALFNLVIGSKQTLNNRVKRVFF